MHSHPVGRWLGGAALVAAVAAPARAEKILVKDATTINLGVLLQPQVSVARTAPDDGAGTDFFVRRARLMVYGELTERVGFFVETEQLNLGKDGVWDTSMYIQDASMSLRVTPGASPGVWLDAGMLLVPFTRHALQSAVSLNGLDYHAKIIQYPGGSTRVWRDAGVQARAALGPVQLRAGVFNGVEGVAATATAPARNLDDAPRLAGLARVSILGDDKGFFYPGLQFTPDPVLSVGLGADWQHGAIATAAAPVDHLALAADVYLHLPTADDQAIEVQATAVRYDDGATAPSTGIGGFIEAGFRVGRYEPVIAYDHLAADLPAGELRAVHLAANAFLDQHRTNLKLDVARIHAGVDPIAWTATLQAQLSL